MNGSEVEIRRQQELPKTTIGSDKIIDLTLQEKQDLVLFSGTPAYSAISKLFELMMVELRDEAVRIPSHKKDERLAALDLASAAATIYTRFKETITFLLEDHLSGMRLRETQEAMAEQGMLENILLSQISQGR